MFRTLAALKKPSNGLLGFVEMRYGAATIDSRPLTDPHVTRAPARVGGSGGVRCSFRLDRTERDIGRRGPQGVTVEDTAGSVHLSRGRVEPASQAH